VGWIGVDLDGTLAHYDHWRGPGHIGEPVEPMLERVKEWLKQGRDVKIFTARVCYGDPEKCRPVIEAWCLKHLGQVLKVTNEKDFGMIELWDDRCIQVYTNQGTTIT
jgi:hypothetical protein